MPFCWRGNPEVIQQFLHLLDPICNGLYPAPLRHLLHWELAQPFDLAGESLVLGLAREVLPIPSFTSVPERRRGTERTLQLNCHVLCNRCLASNYLVDMLFRPPGPSRELHLGHAAGVQ